MTTPIVLLEGLRNFAVEVTAKSSSAVAGADEDQLRAPFEALMRSVGRAIGKDVVLVGETGMGQRIGRPDYGVTVGGVLTGHAELKAPGKGVRRSRFTGHDRRQFDRFSQLPNILYTDGNEWVIYHYGQSEGESVRLKGDVSQDGAAAADSQDAAKLLPLLIRFLEWEPVIRITPDGSIDLNAFARQLAPLCKFLRDDVKESLDNAASPLVAVAREWRALLFPQADDEQFADAYAQTVAFALLLARNQEPGGGNDQPLTFYNAQMALETQHTLMSVALQALTDPDVQRELHAGLNSLLRLIGAVPSAALAEDANKWLYFYEDFLAAYDPKLRKDAGVYYTPIEVVQAQVRLVNSLLVNRLDKQNGFADSSVITIDPAAGTGTYLLSIIGHSLEAMADRYGPGAVPGHAEALGLSLYGFEIMTGAYAVTQLRIATALRSYGATLPAGTRVYLTDTLESPERQPPQGNFYVERMIARQAEFALEVKKSLQVLVCIGNPPYDRTPAANASGGWVRYGDEGVDDRPIFESFLEPARAAGHSIHIKNLYNLYAFFWRWALWKVFEQAGEDGPGIVSFISASSYLAGNAFAGMREHLRRLCDELWIIDLGGENRGPRKSENVFSIQTPVAIAIAFRAADKAPDNPARVHYTRIEGTRSEKLAHLGGITDFTQIDWQDCPSDWQAAFMPAGQNAYFDLPLLTDLMPWQHSGVELKRTWPISPSEDTLRQRWQGLLQSNDRAYAMRATEDRDINKSYKTTVLGQSDTTPIAKLKPDAAVPQIHRYAFRFLDRQFLLGDGRLISRPRPPLWDSFSENQLFLISKLTSVMGQGAAMVACSLVPDRHHMESGAKDVLPLYRNAEATEPNITPGLLQLLGRTYGREISPEDFAAYLYGIMAHPAYTERYYEELNTRQVRVPMTRDGGLFEKVRNAGARLLRLHTYGQRYVPPGQMPGHIAQGSARSTVAVPQTEEEYPQAFRHDPLAQTLHVGEGEFAPVSPAVYEFEVSGLKVVQSWLSYRRKDGAGRQSSPLDKIRPATWPTAFTTELLHLLWTVEATIAVYPEQADLLKAVVEGECFAAGDLPAVPPGMRQPPKSPRAGGKLV